MKKTLKVALVMLAVLVMALPVFAQGGTEQKAAAPAGPTKITLMYGASVTEAGGIPDDWVGYQIIKDKLNIDLTLQMLPSGENDQDAMIGAAGAANNLPDLFQVSRTVLSNLVKQGLVLPVDDLFAKMPTRTSQMYDAAAKQVATFNGKVYGLASPGAIAKNEGLLIRKDWLDKLGLAVPTTTEELMEVMKAFTYNDPDGNGKNDTWGYGAFIEANVTTNGYPGSRLLPLMGAFGVEGLWSFDEATAGLNMFKPEYFEFMQYVKSMLDEGVMHPNWLAFSKDDFRAAWKQGQFGIMKEQNAAFAATANYAPFDANFPDGEWIVIDPIAGPKGDAAVGAYDLGFRIYAIAAKSADKADKIAELLEWMSSEEGYYLCGYGVEGVNYTKDANGVAVATEGDLAYTGAKGQVVTQLRNMVFYNGDIELLGRYPTYTTAVSGKEMSALVVLREMQSKDWTPNFGANTVPQPNADVRRFYEQSIGEFFTGKTALTQANWNKFIADFKAMGGQAWNDQGVQYMKDNGYIVK